MCCRGCVMSLCSAVPTRHAATTSRDEGWVVYHRRRRRRRRRRRSLSHGEGNRAPPRLAGWNRLPTLHIEQPTAWVQRNHVSPGRIHHLTVLWRLVPSNPNVSFATPRCSNSRPTATGTSVLALCSYHDASWCAGRRSLWFADAKRTVHAYRSGRSRTPSNTGICSSHLIRRRPRTRLLRCVLSTSDERIASNSQPRAVVLVSGPPLVTSESVGDGSNRLLPMCTARSGSRRHVRPQRGQLVVTERRSMGMGMGMGMGSVDGFSEMVRWQGPGQCSDLCDSGRGDGLRVREHGTDICAS